MLINLRNALMTGKRLPYDAEVEFLATTGGQYINTSIIGSSATKVEITAYSTNTTDYMSLFGARNAYYSNRPSYSIWQRSSVAGGMRMRFDYNSASSDSLAGGDWNASTVNTITKDNVSNYINGTLASTNTAHSFSLDIPFYLGTINGSGTPATYYFVGRIYSCKMWDANGTLVRDFIPVRKGTTGYLYDRVSGKLFGNAGTGDFVVGPDVVPVEYIESHGTEWIAAGFNITNAQSFAYDIKFDLAQTITNAQPRLMSNEGAGAGNYYDIYYALNALRIRQANAVIGNVLRDVPIVARMTEQGRYYGYYESSPESLLWDVTRAYTAPTVQMNYKIFDRANYNQEQYRWQGKAWYMRFWKDGVPIRFFLPVRVGTDATSWEGAIMDVLTRRIYRNAGTGAFTYGNDLKYPIPAS